MELVFDKNKPIYQQLIEHLQHSIAKGDFLPGDKVPAVRELAVIYQVNPNTMQKALAKLEELGYMYTERTSGRYITQDSALIEKLKSALPHTVTEAYIQTMTGSGMTLEEIPAYVQKHIERMRTLEQ